MPKLVKASITAKRRAGHGRGEKLGIPTINVEIPKDIAVPYGVYAGWLIHSSHQKYPAAIHFGSRPQFNETDPSLELYILEGTVKNLPDIITFELVAFIREIQKFDTVEDMLKQIEIDLTEIKQVLAAQL